MKLKLDEEKYPNGDTYYDFYFNDVHIGSAIEKDGGYLVWNKRKPVASKYDAAKQMIDKYLNEMIKGERFWRKMMMELKRERFNEQQRPGPVE